MDEKMREIEERLIRALKYPEQMQIEQDCRYLLTRIKELEEHATDLGKKLFNVINEKLELEEGIEKFDNDVYEEHAMSKVTSKSLAKLLKLIEKEKP